ncbi:MAG: dipeptidase [Gammaproteobacteria bacterium]|nr:dipeptidase [Gammaproteobacteria bacterium]MDH3536084.1 dipeptidase [Gammaproteobacteria bacterium]
MSENLEKLYREALVWDAHAGVFPGPEVDLNLLDEWRQQGVSYLSINVGFDVMAWQETMATLAAYRRWVLDHGDRFVLVGNVDDIDRARVAGKFALSFDIEGMNALNDDINMVSVYHALGVRQMLFAYNLNNAAAGGCHDEDTGLTDFGRAVLREMNRVGMIVDCSHAAYRTTMDLMNESSKPVVFSHSNPVAVWNHQRNICDDQIRACAANGGVIGLNGMGIFLGDNDIGIDTMLQHVRYVSELVGSAHIGFGFDYSPDIDVDIGVILRSRPDYWPAGQQYDTRDIKHAGPAQLPSLVEALAGSGFDDEDIRGFLGENFRRVATSVWQGS